MGVDSPVETHGQWDAMHTIRQFATHTVGRYFNLGSNHVATAGYRH